MRIVLADDHPVFLSGLEHVLRSEPGVEIVERCSDGNTALEAVRRRRPDLLIADLKMPGRSGLDLLGDVSAAGLPVRVILLTARIDHDEVLEAIRLGVSGIVLKESAALQLLDCVRRVAAGHQWIDQVIGSRTLDGVLRRQAAAEQASATLTPREIEVVRMVAAGLRNKEIAHALGISEGTVKTHVRTIFEKLGIENRMKLGIYARENALV